MVCRELAVDVRSLYGVDCWDVGDVMSEQVFIKEMDVKEKIILLKIIRKTESGNVEMDAKAFKNSEPHIKKGEKIEADLELQPANGNFPESWLVKPVAAKRGGGGGGFKQQPKDEASIAAQVLLKEAATTVRLNDKLKIADVIAEYAEAYKIAYQSVKGAHA